MTDEKPQDKTIDLPLFSVFCFLFSVICLLTPETKNIVLFKELS